MTLFRANFWTCGIMYILKALSNFYRYNFIKKVFISYF